MKKTRLLTLIFAMLVLLGSGKANAEEDPEWYFSITNAGDLVAGQTFLAELYFIGEDFGDPGVANDGKNNLNTWFMDFTYDTSKMQFKGMTCYDHYGTSAFDKIYNGCLVPCVEDPPGSGYVKDMMGSELGGNPNVYWPDDGLDPYAHEEPYNHLGTISFEAKATGHYADLGIRFVDRDGRNTFAGVDGVKYANPAAFYTWTKENTENCSWKYTPPLEVDFQFSPETGDPPLTVEFTSETTGGCEPYLGSEWYINDIIPDLIISEKWIRWIDEEKGTYNVHCVLKNLGGTSAGESAARLYINGTPFGTHRCPTPSGGSHFNFTFDGPFNYFANDTIKVCADCDNEVEEGNELNNCNEGLYHYEKDCTHTFQEGGNYTTTLVVRDNCLTLASKEYKIYVTEPPPPPLPVAYFSASPLRGSEPLVVEFTNESTGGVESCLWDFGNDEKSGSRDPEPVTYYCREDQSYSAYNVSLKVTGSSGTNSWARPGYIVVSEYGAAPVADFSADNSTGIDELTVQFTDLSAGDANKWSWDFGDGGETSDVQNPVHAFSLRDGESYSYYTVKLTVTGPGGSDTAIKPGHVVVSELGSRPAANFTGTPRKGNTDDDFYVHFTDLSAGEIDSWKWTRESTERNPVENFGSPGDKHIILTVTGPGGVDTETKINYIAAKGPSAVGAIFSALPRRKGTPSLKVDFSDLSCGPFETWSWDFDGDGNEDSTDQHPSNIYHNAGTYTVTLKVTSSEESANSTEEKAGYIVVGETPPAADFSANSTSGPSPLEVTFTDESTGDINERFWDFGDGKTSSEKDPVHEYKYEGDYTVKLTAVGYDEYDTEIKTGYITVAEQGEELAADFSADPTSGPAPLTVQFTDEAAGGSPPYTSYAWDFGDNGTSQDPNPSHEYSDTGVYTVSLKVTDSEGNEDTGTKTSYITVTEQGEELAANFSANATSGPAPLTVQFTDETAGGSPPYTSYAWDFDGNGEFNDSTDTNPSHEYSDMGTYTVSLKVTDSEGNEDTETKTNYITVAEAPVADFTVSARRGPAPLTVSFTDFSTGNIESWSWNFGDGKTSTEQNPTYTYSQYGAFAVSLTVSGPGGSSTRTKNGYITVYLDEFYDEWPWWWFLP